MAKRVSMRHKRREAPQWIFPWRGTKASPFPKVLTLVVVGAAFGVLLTSVRIRVPSPVPWAAPKATMFQVPNDLDGRSLRLRAQEGGPFPSRFDPSTWELSSAIEQAAYQAARWRPPPYAPILRKLTDEPQRLQLATPGEAVLPDPPTLAEPAPMTEKRRLAPALYPLSGISADEMPQDLPPFDGEVAPATAAEPWRFLLRVSPVGGVLDCVSLTGSDHPGKPALEAWLRRVSFPRTTSRETRWIAIGLGFTTQPTDGPDAR